MPSVLRRGLPLLASAFINKCGSIGLSLLPMLLVERVASTGDAAAVMGTVKAAGLVGMLLGGMLSDRVGARAVVLLSFALQGVGLGLLPSAPTLVVVALAAVVARAGEALFQSPARVLLAAWAGPAHRHEALGWLRTANNAGQVLCYAIGFLGAGFGLTPLMWFDSATSLFALVFAARALGGGRLERRAAVPLRETRPAGWGPALVCAASSGGFLFLYELFMVGSAASWRTRFGARGLATFSAAMVINTLLCAVVAVWAARSIRDPRVAMPAGALLTAVGATIAFLPGSTAPAIFGGAFVLTLGEIIYTSLSAVTLLQLVPEGARPGEAFARLLVIQDVFRIAGGTLAFPCLVRGAHPAAFVAVCGLVVTAGALYAGRVATRALRPAAAVATSAAAG